MRGIRTLAIVAVVVVLGVLVALPAQAAQAAQAGQAGQAAQAGQATEAGTASAGSANVVRNGHTYTVPSVGACSLAGALHGTSSGVTDVGIVAYGPANSTCAADATAHTSKSLANGTNFTLSVLQSYGGPTIKVANYQVSCSATTGGTNAAWQFSGLSGITIPQQIPNNYVVPVKTANGHLLANVILNEVILPDPNDGSITLNMMHIVLFPTGTTPGQTPLSGNVYVGSTACSPTP
jgi:hypothetical protein